MCSQQRIVFEAVEESAFLLTISWRRDNSDASESLSSTQRRLDEDAVSRMDDEGGAPDAALSRPVSPESPVLVTERNG